MGDAAEYDRFCERIHAATCVRDDSTECDCPACRAAEDRFWDEQGGTEIDERAVDVELVDHRAGDNDCYCANPDDIGSSTCQRCGGDL